MATETKSNSQFNFNQWLTQYKLTDIKQCFIDHKMNRFETLTMENDNFGELIQDQRITRKSHLIPNIIAAIESLKPSIKTLSNGLNHNINNDNNDSNYMYKQINSDKLDTMNARIDEMFNNLQKTLINKKNEMKQLIKDYKSQLNQNENNQNNNKNTPKLEIFSFEINNLQNICDDLELSMKQFVNTLNEKKIIDDNSTKNDEDIKEDDLNDNARNNNNKNNGHQFDVNFKNKNMALTNSNKTVTMKGYYEGSIFLNKTISSGHHQYKFKIVQKAGYSMHIGLWRYSKDRDTGKPSSPPINTFFTNGMDQGYGYQITHGYKSRISDGKYRDKYGVIVDEGDIITMDINFDEQSLIFYINNKSLGISHKIIKDDYLPAIYIYKYFNEAAIVEIMD